MLPRGGAAVFFVFILGVCCAQEVLQAPGNQTVFLNQSAVFTCETDGGSTGWSVNGTELDELPPAIEMDLEIIGANTAEGTRLENLTIPAKAEYNGTRVSCFVQQRGGPFMESANVTLRIQGPLSAVGDLKVDTKNASSVTISWSAPFSLDVTGVDPDIWYSVLIYNVTDENNPTAIPSVNVTNTSYTFTPDSATPCQKFLFSVIPFNGAGQGERSHNITGSVTGAEVTDVSGELVDIKFVNNDKCNVTFRVSSDHMESLCNIAFHDGVSPQNMSAFNDGFVTFLLPADQQYFSTKFEVYTPGRRMDVPLEDFTTFDLQIGNASSDGIDGVTIFVMGDFINNTIAKGFFVVLQCEDGSVDVFRAVLPKNDSSTSLSGAINSVPPSTYAVFFYDLENDGLPNRKLAYQQNSTIVVENDENVEFNSKVLKNASIFLSGSEVIVVCEFIDNDMDVSCVVVYRKYGNDSIQWREYPMNTDFPVTVAIDKNPGSYTFAVFGKKGSDIEEMPVRAERLQSTGTSTPATDNGERSSIVAVGFGVGVGVGVGVVLVLIVLTIVIMWKYKKKQMKSVRCKDHPSSDVVQSETCGSFTSTRDVENNLDGCRKGSDVSVGSTVPLMDNEIAADSGLEGGMKGENAYATLGNLSSGVQRPLPVDSSVQYQEIDIKTTHKMARSQYADLGPLPAGKPKPLEMDTKTQCPYVTILPHATTPVNDNGNRGPPTVESVMSLLWGVAGRWKEIAEGLEFDEDLIDEIDTNNSMDEGCLQVFVEIWVFKRQPSWKKLSHVLEELGEVELARQALNKEPQEQWQVPSRQTSDSSSSGVVADASSQSTDFSGEMVPGVEKTVAPEDGNNGDGTRGGKNVMPDDYSSGEQGARPVFLAYPALHEEAPTVSESCDEDEDTKCDVGTIATVESETGEKVAIVSGTNLFDFLYKKECLVLPPLESNDDPDFAKDPVSTQGSDDDYHSESISSGRQISAATTDTAKVVGRDFIPGGVVVVPQQSTGFSGFTGPEETDTARSPFRQPAKGVVNDSLTSCVNESQQSAGRFGLNKAVYPSLSLLTGAGMLVVGGPYTRRDIFKTVPLEPPPEPEENQSQPSPEETDSSQPLPPDPTPPQSQHAEVSPLQLQENFPPSPPSPPPPPLLSSEIEEKVSTPLKKRQYLDPPGNYQEKIVKWLHTGATRGFHGPDLLVKLCSGGSLLG